MEFFINCLFLGAVTIIVVYAFVLLIYAFISAHDGALQKGVSTVEIVYQAVKGWGETILVVFVVLLMFSVISFITGLAIVGVSALFGV
jgi:hypothetical protein